MAIEIKVLFRGLHLYIRIFESEGSQHIVGSVFDDENIAGSLNYAVTTTSLSIAIIGWSRRDLSVTFFTVTLRINGIVQPVSS